MKTFCVGMLAVLLVSSSALAAPFLTSNVNNDGIYLANVASRVDANGHFITSVKTEYAGGAASTSDPNVLVDGMGFHSPVWTVTGLNQDGASASAIVDLGQVWTLSQVWSSFGGWTNTTNITYMVQLSATGNDNEWTTVADPKAIGQSGARPETYDVFAPIDAQYIRWTVFGADGAPINLGINELAAYVSSTANVAPQLDDGFNVARQLKATSIDTSNITYVGWFNLDGLFDGMYNNDGGILPQAGIPDQEASSIWASPCSWRELP